MPQAQDPLALGTAQHVDDMIHAEAFTGPLDTGKKFLGGHGEVFSGDLFFRAVVAGAAVVAGQCFDQGVEPLVRDPCDSDLDAAVPGDAADVVAGEVDEHVVLGGVDVRHKRRWS